MSNRRRTNFQQFSRRPNTSRVQTYNPRSHNLNRIHAKKPAPTLSKQAQQALEKTGVSKTLRSNFSKLGSAMTAVTIALYAKNTLDNLRLNLESRSKVIAETKNGYGTGQRY